MKLIYIENYHRHGISAQDWTNANIYVLHWSMCRIICAQMRARIFCYCNIFLAVNSDKNKTFDQTITK